MSTNNKVKYNLKNAHYALLTFGAEGAVTYGTPVPMPGSVSISLDANGEPENFYADGIAYYVINNNMGYEGDLELAMIPESFRTDALKESWWNWRPHPMPEGQIQSRGRKASTKSSISWKPGSQFKSG